jgi:transposase
MRYTSDLTDAEWQLIDYCFPEPAKTGRPREHEFRELVNAIFYLTKTGCQWRNLPEHFARWGTVYHYFRLWKRNGLWVEIHTHFREHVRLAAGRNRHPSAGIIDQTSGFGRIEAIGATIGVPRDIHVRPNVVGFGISQMAKRTIAEDLGV